MTQPQSGHPAPIKVQLVAGVKHALCTCGRSADYPLCDGTHRGSEARPCKFVAARTEELWYCTCGQSASFPACDGSRCLPPADFPK
jgi:CDGSH-type Zn-finger protein